MAHNDWIGIGYGYGYGRGETKKISARRSLTSCHLQTLTW